MSIGTLGEKSLHAALKQWYSRPGDQLETRLEGYVIDIVRANSLIEIQTRNFGAMKSKLLKLTQSHRVHLVHPIAQDRWIVKLAEDGQTVISRRKSPRRGSFYHLFNELIRIPELLAHPNFSLEVLLIQDEEIRQNTGQGSWRRAGWSIADRKLIGVLAQTTYTSSGDYLTLLPPDLPQPFTTRDVSEAIKQPLRLVQKMVYCLRHNDLIHLTGKRGKALLYSL